MPRRRPDSQAIPSASLVASANGLVAASTRYSGRERMERIYHPNTEWQKECYRHYSICGEARFAAVFYGNAVSRAKFYAEDATGRTIENGEAADIVAVLDDQIKKYMGIHLTVAGECYLIGRTYEGADVWEVASVMEVNKSGAAWTLDYGDGKRIELEDDDVVIRIWLPNPSKQIEADSPFRTMLPILREIEWLTRHVFAQITSRLAGAGILFLPQGITFPQAPGTEGRTDLNEAELFMLNLGDAMMKPIDDPGSPSAVIPNVAMVPGEQIDQIKLLHFWSDLDSHAKDLRQEAIQRFATGMDLPREQILGMSSNPGTGGGNSNGVSHWGAWQIEEATIKMHVEPMLDVIVHACTLNFLRPALGEGSTEKIGYDTSTLRLRPDRSKEAFELWDRGVLSTQRLLEENGFKIEDLPPEEEFKKWLLVKIASGSATPEQVEAALNHLGVNIRPQIEQHYPPSERTPPQLPPAPSIADHPTRPRTPAESALLAASNALVFRALERAGNRMRQGGVKPPGVPSYETHTVFKVNGSAAKYMTDAWACAPQVLEGIADPEVVIPKLDAYCQSLLTQGVAHRPDLLATWMEKS